MSLLQSSRFPTILLLSMTWGAAGMLVYLMAHLQLLVWLSILPVGLARLAIALFLSPLGPVGAIAIPATTGGWLCWKQVPIALLAVPPILLLGLGCSKVRIDTQGTTPYVYQVARSGDIEATREQLLIHMARFGQPQELAVLIRAGTDVNATDPRGGTALSWTQDPTVVAQLLEAGAVPSEGAIASAAFWGNAEQMTLLLDAMQRHGQTLSPDTASDILFTASHIATGASEGDRASLATQLLEQGADPNTTDDQGNSVLMQAAEQHYTAMVQVLLQAGANPNYQNPAGDTALHWAVSISLVDGRGPATVGALLAGKADPHLRNRQGQTVGDRLQEGLEQVEAEASHAKPNEQELYERLRQDYQAIGQQLQRF